MFISSSHGAALSPGRGWWALGRSVCEAPPTVLCGPVRPASDSPLPTPGTGAPAVHYLVAQQTPRTTASVRPRLVGADVPGDTQFRTDPVTSPLLSSGCAGGSHSPGRVMGGGGIPGLRAESWPAHGHGSQHLGTDPSALQLPPPQVPVLEERRAPARTPAKPSKGLGAPPRKVAFPALLGPGGREQAVEGGPPDLACLALGPGPPPVPWASPGWQPTPERQPHAPGVTVDVGPKHPWKLWQAGMQVDPWDREARNLPSPSCPTHLAPPTQPGSGGGGPPCPQAPRLDGGKETGRDQQDHTVHPSRAPMAPHWRLPRPAGSRGWGLHTPCRKWDLAQTPPARTPLSGGWRGKDPARSAKV